MKGRMRDIAAAAGTTLIVAAVVAGCAHNVAASATSSTTPVGSASAGVTMSSSSPTGAAVSAPTPSVSPTVAAVPAGTVLTTQQAASLPKGTTAYRMPDGSQVAVVRDEPLPAPVKSAVTADAQALQNDGDANNGYQGNLIAALQKKAAQQTSLTGKNVIIIYKVYGSLDGGDHSQWLWCSSTRAAVKSPSGAMCVTTKDDAIQQAQAYIAGRQDPASWEIIVAA